MGPTLVGYAVSVIVLINCKAGGWLGQFLACCGD